MNVRDLARTARRGPTASASAASPTRWMTSRSLAHAARAFSRAIGAGRDEQTGSLVLWHKTRRSILKTGQHAL